MPYKIKNLSRHSKYYLIKEWKIVGDLVFRSLRKLFRSTVRTKCSNDQEKLANSRQKAKKFTV